MTKTVSKKLKWWTFIDICAGIGGFHSALASHGARCTFASEIDKDAAATYEKNYGLKPRGDIREIDAKDIPMHDILCAGFPCQTFSISGDRKGFADTRGTLIFDILRIAKHHFPKIILLENVPHLLKHDGGKTFEVICGAFDDIGYKLYFDILDSANFDTAQCRERVYIVCVRKHLALDAFSFPRGTPADLVVADILEDADDERLYADNYTETHVAPVGRFLGTVRLGHINKGFQGERVYATNGKAITLNANGGGKGANTGLYLVDGKVRKLTVRECARLQGFPETFVPSTSRKQGYRQFGNAVSVPVASAIAAALVDDLIIPVNAAIHARWHAERAERLAA